MRIGIDIRPLQGHHRVRGIGMHIKALLTWVLTQEKSDDTFVFYVYKQLPNPIDSLPHTNINIEIVYLSDYRNNVPLLPTIVSASIAYFRRVLSPIPSRLARKSDVFLAFDFMLGMPRQKDVKYVLVGYDLIQILYERNYLPDFKTSRRTMNIRMSAFSSLVAFLYKRALKIIVKNNTRILSISDNSKNQFVDLAGINENYIRTVYLGNPISDSHFVANKDDMIRVEQYKKDSFLLFIGGADWRRKIDDLVAAFNMLKARGHDIKLILAGFDFQSIDTITTVASKLAIINSSYSNDIVLLGYINDSEKKYLYENALSFVYPSLCEGFGLPILEAVQEHCPVIAYNGPYSSMAEVSGKGGAIIIESNHIAIYKAVVSVIDMTEKEKHNHAIGAEKNSRRFSWDDCAQETITALKDTRFLG